VKQVADQAKSYLSSWFPGSGKTPAPASGSEQPSRPNANPARVGAAVGSGSGNTNAGDQADTVPLPHGQPAPAGQGAPVSPSNASQPSAGQGPLAGQATAQVSPGSGSSQTPPAVVPPVAPVAPGPGQPSQVQGKPDPSTPSTTRGVDDDSESEDNSWTGKLGKVWESPWGKAGAVLSGLAGLLLSSSVVSKYLYGSWNPMTIVSKKEEEALGFDTISEDPLSWLKALPKSKWFYPVVAVSGVVLCAVYWFRDRIFGTEESCGAEDAGFTTRSFIGKTLRGAKKATGINGRLIWILSISGAIMIAAIVAVFWCLRTKKAGGRAYHQEYDIENQYGRR